MSNQRSHGAGGKGSGRAHATAYTDGACSNNGGPNSKAGVGVYFPSHPNLKVSEPMSHRTNPTNSNAEIRAATRAVQNAHRAGIRDLTVKSDSQLLTRSMTERVPTWKENNWRKAGGGQVKNQQEFKGLVKACDKMENVKFEYVPGHSGNEGNAMADKYAREGAKRY